jgi:hypothetical protein
MFGDDGDVGAERQVHDDVDPRDSGLHGDVAPRRGGEVDQCKRHLVPAGRQVIERILAGAVGNGGRRRRSGSQFDGDARQGAAGFVGDSASDRSAGLREGDSADEAGGDCERKSSKTSNSHT